MCGTPCQGADHWPPGPERRLKTRSHGFSTVLQVRGPTAPRRPSADKFQIGDRSERTSCISVKALFNVAGTLPAASARSRSPRHLAGAWSGLTVLAQWRKFRQSIPPALEGISGAHSYAGAALAPGARAHGVKPLQRRDCVALGLGRVVMPATDTGDRPSGRAGSARRSCLP